MESLNYNNERYNQLGLEENNLNNNLRNNLSSPTENNKITYDTKIQELIDNQKILNTLRSIKSTQSLNYEEIKNLPSLFLDIQEALKKSNTNVLELKETINEQIIKENKLKNKVKEVLRENENLKLSLNKAQNSEVEYKTKIDQMKLDLLSLQQSLSYNSDLQRKYEDSLKDLKATKRDKDIIDRKGGQMREELGLKDKEVDALNETVANLKKTLNDLQMKTKKYKTNQLTNIEEKLDEINVFKQEIKELQGETNNLRNKVKELEEERKVYLTKENNFKEELKSLTNNNKKIKSDLKNELNEKINILKELDSLKNNQKIFYEKHESLKNIIENTTSETEKISNKLKSVHKEKGDLEMQLSAALSQVSLFEEVKMKYQELNNDLAAIVNENTQLREELAEKKFSDQDVFKLSDKYEVEIFNLKCELNVWKLAFLEIAKYKLISYDDSNSEDLVSLDKNYLYNAPSEIRQKSEGVVAYFKSLIEEENYHTINLKSLKEALMNEQEKSNFMREQLNNELHLRRKIHNRYMTLRGNLRVMCRLRPFIENESNSLIKKSFLDTFSLTNETVMISENGRKKNFEFDYIFNQKSHQNEVYEEVSLLVQSMGQGNNICIIAYGQTCTGKTYTIQGPGKAHPGIAVKSAKEIFEMLGSELLNPSGKKSSASKLSLSIIEIYNENIYNLLGEDQPLLNIYENSSGNLVIPDLNPVQITNFNEASKLFTLASKLRHTNTTSYNDRSSRSHCIYSFHLKIVNPNDNKITRSKLHIIDLAGSERIGRHTNAEDEVTKKEAIFINLSLHALSNVLNALALKQNHVPYRDSKLTHFLKESLNENYNILLLLHLSPNVRDLAESISTLEFGTRIIKICKHKTGKEKLMLSANTNYVNK